MEMLYSMLFFHCVVGSKLYSPAHYKLCHICSQSAKIHWWKTIYIKSKRDAKFCVVVDLPEKPIIYFSSDVIKAMAQLSAEIEFDMYIGWDEIFIMIDYSKFNLKKLNGNKLKWHRN